MNLTAAASLSSPLYLELGCCSLAALVPLGSRNSDRWQSLTVTVATVSLSQSPVVHDQTGGSGPAARVTVQACQCLSSIVTELHLDAMASESESWHAAGRALPPRSAAPGRRCLKGLGLGRYSRSPLPVTCRHSVYAWLGAWHYLPGRTWTWRLAIWAGRPGRNTGKLQVEHAVAPAGPGIGGPGREIATSYNITCDNHQSRSRCLAADY